MPKAKTESGVANQRAAALRNSKRSTGPRTEAGRAAISRNALRHGLTASKPPLLTQEDSDRYQELRAGLVAQYEPVGPLEDHLIDQIAMSIFKQRRAWVAAAAIQQAALLPSVDVQPVAPEEVLSTAQLQEYCLLKQLAIALADNDLELTAGQADLSQREEAETEGWLQSWPGCWEHELLMTADDIKEAVEDTLASYPMEVLPYRLPHALPAMSEDQIARWSRLRSRAIRALVKDNHPYGLADRLRWAVRSLEILWENDDNPYRLIVRLPTAALSGSAEADAKRVQAEWERLIETELSAGLIHSTALELHEAIAALTQAVTARLDYYQGLIEQENRERNLAQEAEELLKFDLPERLDLVQRYEIQSNHQLEKAVTQLLGLQKARLEGYPITVKLT